MLSSWMTGRQGGNISRRTGTIWCARKKYSVSSASTWTTWWKCSPRWRLWLVPEGSRLKNIHLNYFERSGVYLLFVATYCIVWILSRTTVLVNGAVYTVCCTTSDDFHFVSITFATAVLYPWVKVSYFPSFEQGTLSLDDFRWCIRHALQLWGTEEGGLSGARPLCSRSAFTML